ncbi:MAG: DMT family transporter, partial [Gammaproteobacteria bacterium]|nr:DMT family transporter [Gammaproteobacteria bacterium]
RVLDDLGAGSIYLTAAGVLLPVLLALPWLLLHFRRIFSLNSGVWAIGITFAVATAFYAEGALRGNVARTILLFYLTPVWSTLLARVILNEPVTPRRVMTLVLGLLGMVVILGVDSALPLPRDLSEWLGLIAGFSWGLAMVFTQRNKEQHLGDMASVAFLSFAVIYVSLTLIPEGRHWGFESSAFNLEAVLWILGLGLLWIIPPVVLTLYGATEVEPGKVAILLMLEVIIGVGTATWLTDEPFGLRELLGALLIIAAGVTEFIPIGKTSSNKSQPKKTQA